MRLKMLVSRRVKDLGLRTSDLGLKTPDLGLKMDGILIIDKPSGITSHDVVLKSRRILKQKKIGHAGTLDPIATGVLVLCIGRATKIAQFLQSDDKEYEGEIIFGIKTNTGDITGEIVEEKDCSFVNETDIKQVFNNFIGELLQTPPAFSAISVNGERLYKLARRGVKVNLEPRKIKIYNLEMLDFSKNNNTIVSFRVKCSKGTYIRSLCEDVGKSLGRVASLKSLKRISSGNFNIKDSFNLEEIEEFVKNKTIEDKVLSMSESLAGFNALEIKPAIVSSIMNGVSVKLSSEKLLGIGEIVSLVNESKELIALGKVEEVYSKDNLFVVKPFKVFPFVIASNEPLKRLPRSPTAPSQ